MINRASSPFILGVLASACLVVNAAHGAEQSHKPASEKEDDPPGVSSKDAIGYSTEQSATAGRGTLVEIYSAATDGHWGTWGNTVFCAPGKYVYGYRLRSESNQGSGDDSALNDIELYCASPGSTTYSKIWSAYMSWGTWSSDTFCAGTDNPVVGFDIRMEPKQGSGDDSAANEIDLYCDQGGYVSASTNTSWGNWTDIVRCPTGMAAIGLRTRVEYSQGSGDDTALNGLRLICAAY